jgi:hypothetical protein
VVLSADESHAKTRVSASCSNSCRACHRGTNRAGDRLPPAEGEARISLIVPQDLPDRIAKATRAFVKAPAWQPAATVGAPPAAATIEAALITGEPKRALELAELAFVATEGKPADDAGSARVWLAWALCASGQPIGALDQLSQIKGDVSALAKYVAARAEHLKFEHGVGAIGAVPPLVTAADVAVVTLARGRGGAAWMTGGGSGLDGQLSSADVKAAVAEHREITARCLDRALGALDLQPGFVDAAYLVARLAVKAGFVEEAVALFNALAPKILGRPDAEAFDRDRNDLADPTAAVAAARIKPEPPTVKRSRSLKVL